MKTNLLGSLPSEAPVPQGEPGAGSPGGRPAHLPYEVDSLIDGRFLVREVLGESGMASLYRCADARQDNSEVVVKVPRWECEIDPATFERFMREERIGLQLAHPGLVRVHAIDGAKGRPYIVMESLRGRTLDRILGERPLPEAEALRLVGRLCDAVAAMHARGFVHRDLKPSNVMLCTDGSTRILDFGLAAPPERSKGMLARLGGVYGTPQYMAPEQVSNAPVDERADVYSLGAILYELLAGEPPFRREDPWESAYARMSGDPEAPRALQPGISEQAEEIVLRALRRRPADRYDSVLRFKRDLDSPQAVQVTGLSLRLTRPGFKVSLHGTPVLAGLLLTAAGLAGLAACFFALQHLLARH
jgi:serine/threonine protein kinase